MVQPHNPHIAKPQGRVGRAFSKVQDFFRRRCRRRSSSSSDDEGDNENTGNNIPHGIDEHGNAVVSDEYTLRAVEKGFEVRLEGKFVWGRYLPWEVYFMTSICRGTRVDIGECMMADRDVVAPSYLSPFPSLSFCHTHQPVTEELVFFRSSDVGQVSGSIFVLVQSFGPRYMFLTWFQSCLFLHQEDGELTLLHGLRAVACLFIHYLPYGVLEASREYLRRRLHGSRTIFSSAAHLPRRPCPATIANSTSTTQRNCWFQEQAQA